MNYLIFAFRSRAQSMKYYNELKKTGVNCSLINTPREISVGCGLSVKTSDESYVTAVEVLNRLSLNTFLGAFSVSPSGRDKTVRRLFF